MQLTTHSPQTRFLQINTPHVIEQEFQDYFKVLLHKQDDDCYTVPEWESHFNWGNRQFTLRQLDVLVRGHRHLATIAPEIQSFSWLRRLNSKLGH